MIYQSFSICRFFTVPLLYHCGWDSPPPFPPDCISPHHPPQRPPPARLNPLRQCVWSTPTIDRYIVPDRLDRATGQQTGGRWVQRTRGVGGGFEGMFVFLFPIWSSPRNSTLRSVSNTPFMTAWRTWLHTNAHCSLPHTQCMHASLTAPSTSQGKPISLLIFYCPLICYC